MGTVLVAGASGLIGEAAVSSFAEAGWEVLAVSRRPPELEGARLRHLAVDLRDKAACQTALNGLSGITHVVYAALSEQPGLIAGWRDPEQMENNLGMLRNLLEPLAAGRTALRHVTLLQGAKAYGAHFGRRVPIPARERAPRDPHANFYWLQEDWLRASAHAHGYAWTIFRPQVVVGPAWGAAMNPLLALGAYAAIRRELGQPFAYPGGVRQIQELVDPRLLGQAFLWAAETSGAAGETFNITNGDVFAWADAWPALAEAFGVESGPDEPVRLAEFLPVHARVWETIVAREGLRRLSLTDLLGQSHYYTDALLRPGLQEAGPPTLLSTIKLRRAGFGACYDSEDTLRHWSSVLVQRRLIPRPRAV